MKVLVDTSIWSLALRRKNIDTPEDDKIFTMELQELIKEVRVVIIGPIRQELLSGIPNTTYFTQLKDKLSSFEDLRIKTEEYVLAAQFFNTCRQKGIQGSHIDFLICAVANYNNIPIFTNDNDFKNYAKYLNIKIYNPRNLNTI